MLVEDEQLLRAGIRKHIPWEKCGFQVVMEASNGLEALELLQKRPVDLIFLDIKMPGMSGLELLDALFRCAIHTRVVILSGHNEFEYVRQALKYTVVDYLLKPIKVQEVIDLLQSVGAILALRHEETLQGNAQRNLMLEMDLFKLLNGINDEQTAPVVANRLLLLSGKLIPYGICGGSEGADQRNDEV